MAFLPKTLRGLYESGLRMASEVSMERALGGTLLVQMYDSGGDGHWPYIQRDRRINIITSLWRAAGFICVSSQT